MGLRSAADRICCLRARAFGAALMALAASAAILLAGCGSSSQHARRSRSPSGPSAAVMHEGAQLFAEHCHTCHTLLGQRHTRAPPPDEAQAPSLDEVKPIPSEVHRRVLVGGYHMPGFQGTLSEAQVADVVAYVSTISGRDVAAPSASAAQLTSGEQVFSLHCQSCHTIGDRPATATQTYPGTDFHLVKPSIRTVEERVRSGLPEMMPSFRRRLTRAQIDAVAAYVTTNAGR